jgi:ABC-type proline/glycine betaine transport system permease subunit
MFGIMIVATLAGLVFYLVLTKIIYQSGIATLGSAVALLALAVVLDRITRRRAEARAMTYVD